MNPPTWAKNATPPPFGWALNSPKFASISWHRNHTPWKIQAGIRTRKIGKMKVSTPRAGTEDEVEPSTAAMTPLAPQFQHPGILRGAEQQRHRGASRCRSTRPSGRRQVVRGLINEYQRAA
jgi:hypothetical protein